MLKPGRSARILRIVAFGVVLLPIADARATRPELVTAAQYFPATEFRDLEAYEAGMPDAWAEYLASLREAPLFNDSATNFAVRLTVSPAFPGGTVIRISETDAGGVIGVTKRFERGTTKPVTSTIAITKESLSKIKHSLTATGIWKLGNRQTIINTDGQSFLLEVKRGGRYHAVYTDDPGQGPIAVIARLLENIMKSQPQLGD